MQAVKTFLFGWATLFIFANSAQAYRPIIDLGTLSGYSQSEAYFINDNGQIVGWATPGGWGGRACLFDTTGGGANKDLKTLTGYSYTSYAYSINSTGQIVGEACKNPVAGRACLFDPTGDGVNKDLGTLGSSFSSCAYSINESGQIVGWAQDSSGDRRACLFDPTGGGANKDLRTLGGDRSVARSISNSGQIVGVAYNSSEQTRACLFDPTGQGNNIDLNTLINPSSGWRLATAYSINSNGWIVGYGVNAADQTHAYLLIPEPGSAVIMTLGSIFFALRRSQRDSAR